MNLMAFGTGMTIGLGFFAAGWVGVWPDAIQHRWRPPVPQIAKPAWAAVPVQGTVWEEV